MKSVLNNCYHIDYPTAMTDTIQGPPLHIVLPVYQAINPEMVEVDIETMIPLVELGMDEHLVEVGTAQDLWAPIYLPKAFI